MGWQIKTKEGAIYGPVNSDVLQQWIGQKRILEDDFVWMEDKSEWVVIKSVSEMQYLFKEGVQPEIKQEIPKVKAPGEKISSDTLYDDGNILTFQLIADAWRAMLAKGIWSIIGVIFLIPIIIWLGMLLTAAVIGGIAIVFSPFSLLSFPVGILCFLIIFSSLMLGWSAYSLKVARKETVNVGSVFEGFKGNYIWPALGAILLMSLLMSLANSVTFAIWGFYLTLAYVFVYFFIFDENMGPWEAIKASYDATKGYKWRILSVQIMCVFLGILFLGIGLIVTMPLAQIAIASLYYRIRTGRISEKHLRTSGLEYLIVLIPFILIIGLAILISAGTFMEQISSLPPQIEGYLKNLPR